MRRIWFALLAALLLCGSAIPAAAATEPTTEQKFDFLKQKGIFTGFSDGSAGLYQSMTREQFAQVLFKLLDLPVPNGSPSYSDVIKTRWSYRPVEAVSNAGLMVGVGRRKFEPDSPVTVEQLAAVLVRAYGWTGGGSPVSGKVSGWARASVAVSLQQGLIPKMSDYTITATRGLLVEASYAVYTKMQGEQLKVKSVVPESNQVLRVYLGQPASSADKSRFKLKDVLGVEIGIFQTLLNSDGWSITVITERQAAGRSLSLYIDGVPWSYVAVDDNRDTVKPTVASFNRTSGGALEIVYSEPVDRVVAGHWSSYLLSRDLQFTSIIVSDDNRKVTITTTKQTAGTTYRLTVRNVKDLAGNVMDTWSGDFTVPDQSPPRASFQFNASTAKITVTFNEKVNAQQAVNTGYYQIDKGLVVTRADLDADGRTVTLTTSQQKDATVYKLAVSGIRDLSGVEMESQTFQFGGVAHPVQSVELESVSALNENTLEVKFSRPLSDDEIAKLNAVILTDNGASVSTSGWQSFKQRKSSDNRTVTIQFRTAGDTDPWLFRPGHVYTARVTGPENLVASGYANLGSFAGTEVENPRPSVTDVIPIGKKTVKILFSEPVRNVGKSAFRVREKDGNDVIVAGDDLNDTSAIVTEVLIRFQDEMVSGRLYVMTFKAGTVTDAPGWNGWQTKNGSDDIAITFRGV